MNYSFLLRSFEVKRPGAIVVVVFCQTLSIFAVFDGGDLLPGSSAIILLPLMLGVLTFCKGRRRVLPRLFFPWRLNLFRSSSRVGGLFRLVFFDLAA